MKKSFELSIKNYSIVFSYETRNLVKTKMLKNILASSKKQLTYTQAIKLVEKKYKQEYETRD